MTSTETDVTGVAAAVSGIQIDGPLTTGAHGTIGIDPDQQTGATNEIAPLIPIHPPVAESDDALFDSGFYLDVPTMDGQATDKLRIAFSGFIEYEAADAEGQKMFESLTLGKSVSLNLEGVVNKKSGSWKIAGAGTDNEREVVTGAVGVKVESLYVQRPEDLV